LILVLGAGYVGAALAECALAAGTEVVLADNWYATRREQLAGLESIGARVETADIRSRSEVDRLLDEGPERVFLLAAQASRPLSESDPDYTEETNVSGARRVAEAVTDHGGPMLVYGSSLHVYGSGLTGDVDATWPYGPQSDLTHLSKIYAELCLGLYARRGGFELAVLRLGVVYGPSPVEHERTESQTVVDRFRRLAVAGEELPLDDGGRATIGVVHVEDAARILLESEPGAANVAAETITVADVARLARGQEPADEPAFTVRSPFRYRNTLGDYLRR
jgi:UDP-glucose 4-epimerase